MTEPNRNGEPAPANRKLFVEAIAAALVDIKNHRAALAGEGTDLTREVLLAIVEKKLAASERRHARNHRKSEA